jgi:hypothetical protein
MAANSTPDISLVVKHILKDYKKRFTFQKSTDFIWQPATKTISYADINDVKDVWALMHELGHACLAHNNYLYDIRLIAIEAAAWEYAQTQLAPVYDVIIDAQHVQHIMDGYRDWLHVRSMCPECSHTGLQTKANTYNCLNCRCLWTVNDARKKSLRRHKVTIT